MFRPISTIIGFFPFTIINFCFDFCFIFIFIFIFIFKNTTIGLDEAVQRRSADLYEKLRAAGIDVILDDRDERPGVKFKDADLIGFPLRIAVGAKSLANGHVEFSTRREKVKELLDPQTALERVTEAIREAKKT